MWIPKQIISFLSISKDVMGDLREDLAAVRSERDAIKTELATMKTNFDWARMRLNALELENKALIEKAYDIKLPAPSIERAAARPGVPEFDFDDIGDHLAKVYGYPVYGDAPPTE